MGNQIKCGATFSTAAMAAIRREKDALDRVFWG